MHQPGHLERIGVELAQNKSGKESPYLQNGYSNELEENISTDPPGSAHQRLLIVLSNIGYCKDELSYELYNKYRQIWLQSMYVFCILKYRRTILSDRVVLNCLWQSVQCKTGNKFISVLNYPNQLTPRVLLCLNLAYWLILKGTHHIIWLIGL